MSSKKVIKIHRKKNWQRLCELLCVSLKENQVLHLITVEAVRKTLTVIIGPDRCMSLGELVHTDLLGHWKNILTTPPLQEQMSGVVCLDELLMGEGRFLLAGRQKPKVCQLCNYKVWIFKVWYCCCCRP